MIRNEHLDDWRNECMEYYGEELENTPHAHWCNEWDDLPINETCPEFDACTCYDKEV